MRISLFHNPEAGGGVTAEEIHDALRRAGLEVVRDIETDRDFPLAGQDLGAFVAVAGGDGTVRKAARALAGRGVPLAVLPTGTANNIAASLGVEGSVPDVVARWSQDRRVPFDLGVAQGSWGRSVFLESVGSGLVPAGITRAHKRRKKPDQTPEEALASDLESHREALARLAARPTSLRIDGEAVEAELLLVEVLNIASVGPRLDLAADADRSDGLLDLVMAGEADREGLLAYIDGRLAGKSPRLALPLRRARRVEVRGWGRIHVDDELRRLPKAQGVEIEVWPRAIEFLV